MFSTQTTLKRRLEISKFIYLGYSDMDIERITKYNHKTVRSVRNMLMQGEDLFVQKNKLGAPAKITQELLIFVDDMTKVNRRLSNLSLATFANQSGRFYPKISEATIRRARKILGYKLTYPLISFELTEKQKNDRLMFAQKHLQLGTDWSKVLFTDESYFWLNEDHRPLYRKRGERCPEIVVNQKKFPDKILVFGGISSLAKTNLIIIERGTIDHISYVDDLIDGSGLIPEMNTIYGIRNWVFMQDGATAHTCKETIDYLKTYVNILDDWPAMSPDLNPIENLWAIMKRKVYELKPKTIDELCAAIFEVWESISSEMLKNLANSMQDRLQQVIANNGGHTNY